MTLRAVLTLGGGARFGIKGYIAAFFSFGDDSTKNHIDIISQVKGLVELRLFSQSPTIRPHSLSWMALNTNCLGVSNFRSCGVRAFIPLRHRQMKIFPQPSEFEPCSDRILTPGIAI